MRVDYAAHASEALFSIPVFAQRAGQVHPPEQFRGARGMGVYPSTESVWPDFFKNYETRNRIADVLAGK